jgi:L-threonylcarbamoyladenylate synthase
MFLVGRSRAAPRAALRPGTAGHECGAIWINECDLPGNAVRARPAAEMSLFYDCTKPAERVEAISTAAAAVNRGELTVLPTDTVYGLGADAFNRAAVQDLVRTRAQSPQVPVPVLVGSWKALDGLVLYLPADARQLVEAFWPGALTVVVRHAPSLAWDLGDTRGTVAVRMPLHPVALELLKQTGPMAVSSANRTGQPLPTTAKAAEEQLGEAVAVYLDGGPCAEPVASTIVDLTGTSPRLLRAGAVGVEQLREVLPDLRAEAPEG